MLDPKFRSSPWYECHFLHPLSNNRGSGPVGLEDTSGNGPFSTSMIAENRVHGRRFDHPRAFLCVLPVVWDARDKTAEPNSFVLPNGQRMLVDCLPLDGEKGGALLEEVLQLPGVRIIASLCHSGKGGL